MELKERTIYGFRIYYRHEKELDETCQEVFGDREYAFSCSRQDPLILDCGSHIGISILYFKRMYPRARIIAFEPDKDNFVILQKNIAVNGLVDITVINAALAAQQGMTTFYREIDGLSPDTRGNSIIKAWGDRGGNETTVSTVCLSSYVGSRVDYLKLDIEGAECQVLEEAQSKLKYVKELYVEFHGTDFNPENNLDSIISILENNSFVVQTSHKNIRAFLPDQLMEWAKRTNPRLAVIRASNSEYNPIYAIDC